MYPLPSLNCHMFKSSSHLQPPVPLVQPPIFNSNQDLKMSVMFNSFLHNCNWRCWINLNKAGDVMWSPQTWQGRLLLLNCPLTSSLPHYADSRSAMRLEGVRRKRQIQLVTPHAGPCMKWAWKALLGCVIMCLSSWFNKSRSQRL